MKIESMVDFKFKGRQFLPYYILAVVGALILGIFLVGAWKVIVFIFGLLTLYWKWLIGILVVMLIFWRIFLKRK